MKVHVIGSKGVVGSATIFVLNKNSNIIVTGSDIDEEIQPASVYFICVPELNVINVLDELNGLNSPSKAIDIRRLIVIRSTMRPDILDNLMGKYSFCVNPEFLKESTSIWDCFFPKGILIGEDCKENGDIIENIWKFTRAPIYRTDIKSASMIKLVSNVYAATLITFWNSISEICEKTGINKWDVARILPLIDERVSKYGTILGGAYGGKCLPKDVKQLIAMCKTNEAISENVKALFYIMEAINFNFSNLSIARGGL